MNEALTAIHDYYKAFSTLELDACVPFFSLPCMFIGPQGTLTVANREELETVLGPIIEPLKSKDYRRSEFMEPQVTAPSSNTALVRGVAIRYRASAQSLSVYPSVT
jgi:hypothetical protein